MMNDRDFIGFIVVICILSGVLGWAVIEAIIWIFSHISFIWR